MGTDSPSTQPMTDDPSASADARARLDFGAPLTPDSDRQTTCANCTSPLRATYHMLGQSMICGKCRTQFEGTLVGGTGANRFGRALLFGTGAAIVGAAIYYAILVATGYSIGLLAILVGYMVGRAVNIGSHRKGGRKYQVLAAFLTYFAMSSTYIVDGFRQISDEQKTSATSSATSDSSAIAAQVAAADDGSTADASTSAEAPDVAGSSSHPGLSTTKKAEAPHMSFFVALIALIGIVLVAPVIAGFSSPILLLILGFGVYQAWKMNRGITLELSGPFALKPAATPDPA